MSYYEDAYCSECGQLVCQCCGCCCNTACEYCNCPDVDLDDLLEERE
jgi:hypothetical protein